MKRVSWTLVGLGMLGALIFAVGCGEEPKPTPQKVDDVTKVGFIYIGPIGDYGWSKSHDEGRLYVENFGQKIRTSYIEAVPPSEAPARIDELVASGHDIVFTTSFDFMPSALAAPARHPKLTILNCAGFQTGERAGNYQARIEETEYLSGMVAGKMSKTGKIGVVGALRIYETMMHINAFALGVRAVNPEAQVQVRWIGNWYNEAMEVKAAEDLIAAGADVIKVFTDTNEAVKFADGKKTPAGEQVYSLGHGNKDFCSAAPDTCLVSSYYNWGPLYLKLIEEVRSGAYPAQGRIDYVGSAANLEVVGLSTYAPAVPPAVRDLVKARRDQIIEGTFNVFQGPFNHDDGSPWLAAGEQLTDEDLVCTKRFVEGISVLDGPVCASQADCGEGKNPDGSFQLECKQGLCVAPDFSGCGK